MVTTSFQALTEQTQKQSGREKYAQEWHRDQSKVLQKAIKNEIIDPKNVRLNLTRHNLGQMFMFLYDPKHAATLPYYDAFPLVFPIDIYKDGFLGINLHYLPRKYRAGLMDALYATINNNKNNTTTRLQLTYNLLRTTTSMRYFRPCLKRYLFKQVGRKFLYIDPYNWDKALFLPLESFVKQPKRTVHADSVRIIRNT